MATSYDCTNASTTEIPVRHVRPGVDPPLVCWLGPGDPSLGNPRQWLAEESPLRLLPIEVLREPRGRRLAGSESCEEIARREARGPPSAAGVEARPSPAPEGPIPQGC